MTASVFNTVYFQFLIGGLLVASITYTAKYVNPRVASIITAFPIGLIPLFFIHKHASLEAYGIDTTKTNIIVVLSYLIFDYLIRHQYAYVVELTLLAWGAMALGFYLLKL